MSYRTEASRRRLVIILRLNDACDSNDSIRLLFADIPNTATKCCSACFNRIQRRLSAMGVVSNVGEDTNTSPTSVSQLFKWTDEETEALKRGITEHGTKWSEIAQLVGPTKTPYQCRTYFFFNRKKLGLDVALQEFNKVSERKTPPRPVTNFQIFDD